MVGGSWFWSWRLTIMGMEGLWYFRRGRYSLQNFLFVKGFVVRDVRSFEGIVRSCFWEGTNLAPMWPPFRRRAKSMCIRVTSAGRIAAPGPHLMLMSCVRAA